MSKLQCERCKSVYVDVMRMLKCTLCGNTSFSDAEFDLGTMDLVSPRFPWWVAREGTIGFFYMGHTRVDASSKLG